MKRFPADVRFRHPWRPYQERVLREFEQHLADRHFHVVAAPGSGKTVLGLEALRRLDHPTLILAPTLAIRDQWARRLAESFLPDPRLPEWISTDLAEPGFLTVSTYQALHATGRKLSLGTLLSRLKKAGVRTLVVDEAHHLRRQWWQSLTALKAGLEAPCLIALTATPPFDVPQSEWNRYIDLCGPVDAEVHVPELVLAGNLCPHQDYIHFSAPAEEEQRELDKFAFYVRRFINDLALNRELVATLSRHPVLLEPEQFLDAILDRNDYFLSMAIFLEEVAAEIPRRLLDTMGLAKVKLPPFQSAWAEVLLNGMLFGRDPQFLECGGLLEELTRDLRRHGAIDHRQVHLRAPPRLRRVLENSQNKCQSIGEIIELESRADPFRLRAVILCDYIRETDLPARGDLEKPLTRLGVAPVFEYLRKLKLPRVRLGILTGSLVVLPESALPLFRKIAAGLGMAEGQIQAEPLWHAPEFSRIKISGTGTSASVEAVTRLFTEGAINVLTGTASLLGEGWDAPAINTLILGSVIGSYMSSNQMRGRAIRVLPNDPAKTANVWHLACLSDGGTGRPREGNGSLAGADFDLLARRFRSFTGVGLENLVIENGIERLGIDPLNIRSSDAPRLNSRMCRRAQDREGMRSSWRQSLLGRPGTPQRMVMETMVPLQRLPSHPVLEHFLERQWPGLRSFKTWLLKRRVRRIASALLEALCACELVKTGFKNLSVEIRAGARTLNCRLHGATTHEESFFSETLREVFNPVQSPRYLLLSAKSFYTVPNCLGQNQRQARAFLQAWRRTVRSARLIYTRNSEGKHALLRAKETWLASRFLETESRLHWG